MLKCVQNIKNAADVMGANLDMNAYRDGGQIVIDAPPGYVWSATYDIALVEHATNESESWWAEACKDVLKQMQAGLDLVTDENEIKRLSDERDEDWRAPPGSPAHIVFPGAR